MRTLANHHLVAVPGVHEQRDLIAHGAGGHEQRALFAEQRCHAFFQAPHTRIFPIHVITDFGGVGVVVDRMSTPYLSGATIDFVDTIEKQGFTIDNPNATGSCACGDSFN